MKSHTAIVARYRQLAVNCALLLSLTAAIGSISHGQTQPRPSQQTPVLKSRSNIVLVPALVKDKSGEVVFSLTAEDFLLTDNGVEQPLQIEADTDSEPIAVAVIVETGGEGASHLSDYRDLEAILDAVIGGVTHQVAVISFDSAPHLQLDFTPTMDAVAAAVAGLHAGNSGATILDALNFGVELLRRQPPEYRRAILLFSETADSGSQTSLEKILREVDDTNTAIYSFAFSTPKAAVKHEGSKLPRPTGSPYEDAPYAAGGCMSAGSDPDAHGKRDVQALDCASDLLPPLRLVRMAFLAARDGLKRNVPQTVAQLTGGEYFSFKNSNSLVHNLLTVSNDVPNYYVLSFRPASPSPGFHVLKLVVKNRPELVVKSRDAYWVDQ